MVKLVVGADSYPCPGWIVNNKKEMDITKESNWLLFFQKNSIDRIVAEHVLEHLSAMEVLKVFINVEKFLKKGGIFRIAVPDGNHPNNDYIKYVKPPADGHKQLFTFESLYKVAALRVGFIVQGLEYWDNGTFFRNKYNEDDGYIIRNQIGGAERQDGMTYYTSLIVDCIKE